MEACGRIASSAACLGTELGCAACRRPVTQSSLASPASGSGCSWGARQHHGRRGNLCLPRPFLQRRKEQHRTVPSSFLPVQTQTYSCWQKTAVSFRLGNGAVSADFSLLAPSCQPQGSAQPPALTSALTKAPRA